MSVTVNPALVELHSRLKDLETFRKFNRSKLFVPYKKQIEFFGDGLTARERLFMAGNQLGKTEAGAFEAACHLTGDYPDWWPGRRWNRPTRGWIAGESSETVRDGQQKKLCGTPGVLADFGSGYIPREAFVEKPSLARGIADAYDTVQITHKAGGVSIGVFKSYKEGRQRFQTDTIDWGWCDEEPSEEIYSETLTRTAATKGMLFTTFTPLLGRTNLVRRFGDGDPDRRKVTMTIDDVTHIDPAQKAKVIAGYRPHERAARARGVPMMGSGAIFALDRQLITEPTLEYIPKHWGKIWGIDFGVNHPFAAALLLWDRENDVIHVHYCLRMTGEGATITPLNHAYAMKQIGAAVPVAWPHDGNNREKGSGENLAAIYTKHSLRMLPEHATFAEGGLSVEAGVEEMRQRMVTGRWKVGAHCVDWFDEFDNYHRKDGLIVKENDDLLSASRYGMMMRRHAQNVHLGSATIDQHRERRAIAKGVDFDLFNPT